MRKISIVVVVLAAVVTAGFLSSCNDKSTNPYGGGALAGSLSASGGVYAHTFNTAGLFRYMCVIHPSCTTLQGKVTVVGSAVPIQNDVTAIQFSGGNATSCSSLSTFDDSVHVGQVVTWTNNSPLPHTVTTY